MLPEPIQRWLNGDTVAEQFIGSTLQSVYTNKVIWFYRYGNKSYFSLCVTDRVIFLPGTFQNVSVSQNETVQAVVSRIPVEVAFITLQFHTQHRNATLSYTRVRKCWPVSQFDTALNRQ